MKLRRMPIYTTDSAGHRVKRGSRKWYAVWVDWAGTLRRLPLFPDRKSSDEIARKIDRLNQLRGAGESMPLELARYVETMPPSMRAKLAAWDILNGARVAAGQPLSGHLDDWKAALLAKGNTARHAELVAGRARSAFKACGFKFWTDISAGQFQSHLAELRADRKSSDGSLVKGISAQTSNFYLQAAKQFCKWMVRDGRAIAATTVARLRWRNSAGYSRRRRVRRNGSA